MTCKLPGAKPLTCSVGTTHSALMISSDTRRRFGDRIIPKSGKLGTKHQTDDRLALKPAELRTLWSNTSSNPQGYRKNGRPDCGGSASTCVYHS